MAVYRFRIAFEDYDGFRDIDIRSNQSFEDLHNAIHQAIGYKSDYPSSFYVSNDQWHKGEEITIFPNERRKSAGVTLMSNTKLSKFIDDPHQKFYYTFNFDRPLDFHVELTRIAIEAEPGVTYPYCVKSSGEAPKQFAVTTVPPQDGDEFDDTEVDASEDNHIGIEEFGIDEEIRETDAGRDEDGFEGTEDEDIGFGDKDEDY